MESNNFDMIPFSYGERSETCIQILPDEIIFEILLLLPGNILYDVMRYVCRNWYKIIEHPIFVRRHLMLSPTTLLMPTLGVAWLLEYRFFHVSQHLDPGCPYTKSSGFRVELPNTDGKPQLVSSCNGLLLMDGDKRKEVENIYYVGNPVTRRIMPLPPLSEYMHRERDRGYRFCCLAFAVSYKVYKALVVYQDRRLPEEQYSCRRGCSILTLGIDKAWRELNLTHLNEDDMNFFVEPPLSTPGIIYWAELFSSYVLVLDVESECIKPIQLPCNYEENNYILQKGDFISFWQVNPDLSMEVWVLKDHKTGEWVKFSHIESEPIRYAIKSFMLRTFSSWPGHLNYKNEDSLLNGLTVQPRGWLENIETIILCTDGRVPGGVPSNTFFVFDLKARTCTDSTQNLSIVYRHSTPFINSLAWI